MSTKRIYLVALLLALVLPILAACGGGSGTDTASTTTGTNNSPAASASPAASGASGASPAATTAGTTQGGTAGAKTDWSKIQVEEGATLRVSTWGNAGEQKVNQDSFARFNQVFPNVKVEYEPIAENFQTTMKADFAAGTNPDVLYIDTSLMTALAPNEQLLDLKPVMDQTGVKLDDYIGQLSEIFIEDDKVYALPKDFGALALFFNDELAQKAGVDPKSVKTWDDWKAAAQKLTTNGVIGQCVAFEVQRLGALMLQKGVQPVQDGKANLTDPKAAEALQFWADLYKNKQATTAKEIGAGWCGEALAQGKVGMALEGGWVAPFMATEYPDIKYTAIPIPTPPDGKQASLVFTNGWGAAASTKYPQAAAALVLYLTSPENQKPIMETGFALPTVKSLLNDPYFQSHPNEKVLAEAGEYGSLAVSVYGGAEVLDDVVKKIDSTAIEPVFLAGTDPKTALEQANPEVQSILDSQ
jgi:multiple sugar transport system substrate-binding protein